MRGRSLFPFRVISEHLVLFLFYILLFYRSKKKKKKNDDQSKNKLKWLFPSNLLAKVRFNVFA